MRRAAPDPLPRPPAPAPPSFTDPTPPRALWISAEGDLLPHHPHGGRGMQQRMSWILVRVVCSPRVQARPPFSRAARTSAAESNTVFWPPGARKGKKWPPEASVVHWMRLGRTRVHFGAPVVVATKGVWNRVPEALTAAKRTANRARRSWRGFWARTRTQQCRCFAAPHPPTSRVVGGSFATVSFLGDVSSFRGSTRPKRLDLAATDAHSSCVYSRLAALECRSRFQRCLQFVMDFAKIPEIREMGVKLVRVRRNS
jgi:hypothetical protein